jgi:hypothetical protein
MYLPSPRERTESFLRLKFIIGSGDKVFTFIPNIYLYFLVFSSFKMPTHAQREIIYDDTFIDTESMGGRKEMNDATSILSRITENSNRRYREDH